MSVTTMTQVSKTMYHSRPFGYFQEAVVWDEISDAGSSPHSLLEETSQSQSSAKTTPSIHEV